MKLKMYLALLAMGMLSLQSCNDDDDDLPNSKVPEAVRNAFDSSFSNTANLSWETKTVSQGQYYKAEFNNKSDKAANTPPGREITKWSVLNVPELRKRSSTS